MYDPVSFRHHTLRGLLLFLKLILVAFVAYALYWGYTVWQGGGTDIEAPVQLQGYGLDGELPLDQNIYGTFYISQGVETDETIVPQIFSYTSDDIEATGATASPLSTFDYAPGTDGYVALIAYLPNTADPDGYQPVLFNQASSTFHSVAHQNGYRERDLATHPATRRYAYSYQTTPESSIELSHWNVAIHLDTTSDAITIPAAAEPAFSDDGAHVFYMKTDGIYRYDIANGTEHLVFDDYQNLTSIDDFDVDTTTFNLILTNPSIRSISVATLNEDMTATERGRHIGTNTRYRHATISPDGRFYATLTARDEDTQADGLYTKVTLETRAIDNAAIITNLPFERAIPGTVGLVAWE